MSKGAVLMLGDDAGAATTTWSLDRPVTTIGRQDGCDVLLADREVSRRHAEVRHAGDRFVLVDLGSKNGTYVNGHRLAGATPLCDGDEILVAPRFRLLFVDCDATLPSAPRRRGIHVDDASRTVTVAGMVVDPPLAPQQYALLQLMLADPSRVYGRDEIAAHCYPDAHGGVSDQAIDGIVRRLRSRLRAVDPAGEYLVAVRGHGFRLTP